MARSKEELIGVLKQSVIDFEEDPIIAAANEGIEAGYTALDLIMDGLAHGMEIVGEMYERQEYFVPAVQGSRDP